MKRVFSYVVTSLHNFVIMQNAPGESHDLFKVSHYKKLSKFLLVGGHHPHQSLRTRQTVLGISLTSVASFFMIQFKLIFDLVEEEWRSLKLKDGLQILDEVTEQGSKIARFYRHALLMALLLFEGIPLVAPIMDIVLPLNETRKRQQLLKINHVIPEDEHFYSVYLYTSWCAVINVVSIITIDSLYMVICHHICGLFAVCGHQIAKATEFVNADPLSADNQYRQIILCAVIHKKALSVFELVDNTIRASYLFQIGSNMIVISVTAVQAIMRLSEPGEALRFAIYLGAQMFHLLFNSIPGQKIIDYSLSISDDIFESKWYQTPVRGQKVLFTMHMRARRPCALTAGGLYLMNIENFGMICKTCMSYFMMLMSLRDQDQV